VRFLGDFKSLPSTSRRRTGRTYAELVKSKEVLHITLEYTCIKITSEQLWCEARKQFGRNSEGHYIFVLPESEIMITMNEDIYPHLEVDTIFQNRGLHQRDLRLIINSALCFLYSRPDSKTLNTT
jgi:hypothetical protein